MAIEVIIKPIIVISIVRVKINQKSEFKLFPVYIDTKNFKKKRIEISGYISLQ